MQDEKATAVKELTGGDRIPVQEEQGHLAEGPCELQRTSTRVDVGGQTVTAKNIVIATGSSVTPLPGVEVDNDEGRIVDSTGALELAEVPEHLVVIGGGVIGLGARQRYGAGSAPKSPWSNSSTRCCPAWTARCARKPPSCSRSRAWSSSSRPRSPARGVKGKKVTLTARARCGRRSRDDRGEPRAGLDRPPARTPRASASTRSASTSTSAARSRPTDDFRTRSTACGRSAT